jgi:hypothetical protein
MKFVKFTLHRLRVVIQKYTCMIMDPAGPGTNNDCAGEGQQQFTRNRILHTVYSCVYIFVRKSKGKYQLQDLILDGRII